MIDGLLLVFFFDGYCNEAGISHPTSSTTDGGGPNAQECQHILYNELERRSLTLSYEASSLMFREELFRIPTRREKNGDNGRGMFREL
jgi:hypothetical protein